MAESTTLDVSVEAPGGLERRMTVRVPAADIEREINARLDKVGRTARLKGFRPGKIPPKVVRQRYGVQVREEVLSDVIRASYTRAINQEKLQPAGGPRIEPLGGPDEEHFSYRATFEVYPEIALKPVEELSIERPQVQIQDSDIDEMLEKLREQRAEWRPVERKAQEGDRVVIDFVGKIDKEPFPGGEGKDVRVVLGGGDLLEDFDKALRGVVAGETKTAKVKFPKDYHAEELSGKKAVFDITVQQVEERVLPELDEALAKSFGVEEGGVEKLKAEVRANMERELSDRLKAVTRRNALEALRKANPLDVPRALVEQEISNLQAAAMRQLGIEDPAKAPPRAEFQPLAEQRAALALLVQELIREQAMEVDQARVTRRIDDMVQQFEKPQEVAHIYRSSRELMAQVESSVLEEQVVEYLLEHAKVEDKSIDFKAFMSD